MNTIVGEDDGFLLDLNIYPSDTPSPLLVPDTSSSGSFLFGHPLPPLSLSSPWSCPLLFACDQPPPPLSPPMFLPSPYTPSSGPFVSSPPLPTGSPLPLLLPDTPSSSRHLFSPPLPPDPPPPQPPLPPGPPPPQLLPDTPSSGRFLFSPPLPSGPPPPLLLPDTLRLSPLPVLSEQQFQQPRRNEEEEWHSYQASPWRNTEEERWSSTIQASQRQEPEPRRNEEEERGSYWSNQASERQEPRRNAEEERWSSIERLEPWRDEEPGQTTLTEWQIWEALDKLKNQVYTGEACAICLEYFVPEETVSITPCKHMFHKQCLVPWVMQKGQCPHCRFFLFEATRNRW